MLKSKWIASVLALALIVTPVQGVTAAEAVTKNEVTASTEEVRTTSDGNAVMAVTQGTDGGSDAADAVEGKLDVPTGLYWEIDEYRNIVGKWNLVSDPNGLDVVYDVELYRQGENTPVLQTYGLRSEEFYGMNTEEKLPVGKYQFRVQARYPQDNVGASGFSELSPVFEVKNLPKVTGAVWSHEYDNLAVTWDEVTDTADIVYDLEVYREGEKEPCMTYTNIMGNLFFPDPEKLSTGSYTFRVKARQYCAVETAGEYSDFSEVYTVKKLHTPVAKWGEGWMPVLDDSQDKGLIDGYDAHLYKIGSDTYIGTTLWVNPDGDRVDYSSINRVTFTANINSSGDYQFTMTARPERNSGYMSSNVSEISETKNYVKPSRHLDVPVVKAHATLPGVFEVTNLGDAVGCVIYLYYDQGTNGATWVSVGHAIQAFGNNSAADKVAYCDFRRNIDANSKQYGFGQYMAQARAISGNIDEVANSDLSYLYDSEVIEITEKSLPLDMTPLYGNNSSSSDPVITPATTVSDEKVAEIKNSLQNIISNNTNATDAVESIKKSENQEELGAAMQQDSSVAQLMSSIEKDYLKENNITVSKNIATKVNTFMDPNAISVVGAGLNVASGNVALDVSVPNKWVDLGRKYNNYNNLQFEIKLVGDNLAEHGKLAVPVLITMPIPKGLTSSNLEIIHCKTDGTYERIAPKNNGDGTISFAVTEFSTFAFVSPAETSSDDSDDSDDSGSAEVVYNVDWNNVQNTVAANKTGTTDITTGNSMQVSGQLLQTLKDTKGVLALHTGNGIAVSICGKDVKKTDKNVAITFAENPNIPASAKSSVLANALYSRSFEMKEKVLYSVKMDIHFNVGKQFAGKYANLYHYDELTGTMKLEGTYRITDTGAAMFLLYHGDEYILTVTEKAPKGVVAGGVSNADYTVAKGDTLWGIAAKNGISLRKILAANPNIKNPDRIHVGQKIVIK